MYSKVFNSYERSKKFVLPSRKDKLGQSRLSPKRNITINANIAFHVNLSPEVKFPFISNVINPISGSGGTLIRVLVYVAKMVLALWIGGCYV